MIRAVFFGTPEFSVPFLQALLADDQMEVVAVVTQPDKPVGRKQDLTPPPVKVVADKAGVPVLQFPSLKKSDAVEELKKLNADAFVVVAYGKLIPADALAISRLGCINVHPSKLPKYRGPSPIQSAIVNGDTETAVSIMLLDQGMDTGPILAQEIVEVLTDDTTPTLSERLTNVGAPLLVETIKKYAAGEIKPVPQDDSKATICKLLGREDGLIKGDEPAEVIDRKIRAYTPWPGAYTVAKHAGEELRVKLLPGQLVQPEGRKPMSLQEFERGYGPLWQR